MLGSMSGCWQAWQLYDVCTVASGNRAKALHHTGSNGCVGLTQSVQLQAGKIQCCYMAWCWCNASLVHLIPCSEEGQEVRP